MNFFKWALLLLFIVLALWILITVITQLIGQADDLQVGQPSKDSKKAMIIFNPDPFYNFDQQICQSFANGLLETGYPSLITTPQNLGKVNTAYELYVFCANTYNYDPDWGIKRCIKNMRLEDKTVVAITLGAGSTNDAQRKLERLLQVSGANLIDSKAYWLFRPNDDSRMNESNISVAKDLARKFGKSIGQMIPS